MNGNINDYSAIDYSFRNRIINGGFDIWQRGTSYSFSDQEYGYKSADRIISYMQRSTPIKIEKSSLIYNGDTKTSFKATNTQAFPFSQFMEDSYVFPYMYYFSGGEVFDLIGSYITVSFIFKASVSGKYTFLLRNRNHTAAYLSDFDVVSNIPTKVIKTINLSSSFWNPNNNDGLGGDISFGGISATPYNTSTMDQWFQTPSPIIGSSSATIWTSTANNFIEIAEVQFEKGMAASQFERRPVFIEDLLCKRYYWRHDNYEIPAHVIDNTTTSVYRRVNIEFPVPMRVPPEVKIVATKNAGSWVNGAPSVNPDYITENGCEVNLDINGGQNSYSSLLSIIAYAELGSEVIHI